MRPEERRRGRKKQTSSKRPVVRPAPAPAPRCGQSSATADPSLQRMSWTVGACSVILNIFIIARNKVSIKKCRTPVALLTKSLIILISMGDFLVGIYLLLISSADAYYRNEYCKLEAEWLTSMKCSYLGVISTVGSQISLFSMTILSLSRLSGIKKSMRIPGPVTN